MVRQADAKALWAVTVRVVVGAVAFDLELLPSAALFLALFGRLQVQALVILTGTSLTERLLLHILAVVAGRADLTGLAGRARAADALDDPLAPRVG